ncbi:Bromodomain associated [Nesidiocoris tenuis]|uniref:Bromodomain associated n=2 Tax=Nesidiocoris tenuis TaxID=355587 RepID=A0ABN7AZ10_9HEMI|nr:Bromodomain associated [Nesidiocoris tenuis]
MDDYTRKMIQVAVAQTCLNVGWSAIQTSPLEIMTDLLSDYILGLCKRANNYAFLFNQTEPNLDHLGLAFQDLNISIPELEEYVTYFENNNCPEVPQYPVPKESNLNFLKPGSREVVTRPVHVHEHLPPMYPHLEEQEGAGSSKPANENSPPPADNTATPANEPPATPSPSSGLKRRGDHTGESAVIRRARALAEEESRPLREISSVMMTTSGFLSHAREGKLPEVRTIPMHEPEPEEPPETPNSAIVKVEVKSEPGEVKPEKKRKKKAHDSSKKAEKELKIKEEPSVTTLSTIKSEPFPDDSQVKKLVTVKETSKLKVLKPGATKAIALTPDSSTPASKSEKKSRNKRPHSPGAAITTTPTGQPKAKLSKTDRIKERINVDDSANDAFPDIKLTAEPDKQKLNIFKKISKVKDDHEEPKSDTYDHLPPKTMKDNADLLKKTSSSAIIEHIKEERNETALDVENVHSPSAFGSISFSEEFMPDTPTTPKTPDIPKIPADSKKKKREKHKDKKERERFNSSPVSSRVSDDNVLPKPKTPEVVVDSPDDHLPFPFLSYPTGPALIPPNLASNPLIPQMNIMPFPPKIPPPPIVQALAAKESAKEVPSPAPIMNAPVPPSVTPATPPTPLVTPKAETPPTPKKKDKKEKKNKDKIKKKKDKKDKLKTKDKSERKKLKLQKKQKLQEKLKLKRDKKGKKKEAQKEEEKRGDSPSVPKITFKLGPDPQREQSPNPKITIKPVIKKEEDVAEVIKKQAPEPVTTPTIKHHKGTSKGSKAATVTPSDAGHHAKVLELAKSGVSVTIAAPPTPAPVVLKTEPDESNQLWICPACGRPDDGSPMIACDACDMWYHYICVGILEAPESDWFCQGCISKRPDLADKKKKHKKRK